MGKKIQALKETFPRQLPKFSMPKISRPKLSDLRLSDDEQLTILAAIWLVCTILGAGLVTDIFGSPSLLGLITVAIGMLGFSWLAAAARKLRLNDWKFQINNHN